mmetsp:Transcript_19360/g.47860  ORF Transcript_19360/g.47860 Transcript_19360/m.47860 type:complete len:116 (-) Transcript_19360:1434-1781(-)
MGQGASTHHHKRKKRKKSKHSKAEKEDVTLLKLEEKIAMTKQNLIRTKQMGEVEKRNQGDEIYKFEMELYKKNTSFINEETMPNNFLPFGNMWILSIKSCTRTRQFIMWGLLVRT